VPPAWVFLPEQEHKQGSAEEQAAGAGRAAGVTPLPAASGNPRQNDRDPG
jgi:hypothetical protein